MAGAGTTLCARHESLPLARPFRISRGVKTAAEVVTVSIGRDGKVGRGEGVPYPRYGESVESALAAIEAQRGHIEAGASRHDLLDLMPAGAARNALDCALWDLEARLTGQSVFAELGLAEPLSPIPTALTIGLDTPAAMRDAARALAGAPLVKVKVDASDPAAQLRAVREAAPDPRLIVDPNESWSMKEVEGLQDLMIDLRIDLLEQPLPAGEDSALDGFASSIPVAADESIHTSGDLDDLASGYGVVNVKLDKAGGLTGALQLIEQARQRELGIMIGCMISSSLSIAPALALAADSAFADLDGPLWLLEDHSEGISCDRGMLHPPREGFWGAAN
ncbi:N-acetyl-D-Glu racemase DgcA [Alteriqipengyuania lutimaris]|uniref:Dipeptide epimerase n=1 Tax=Alteriqipengyuania lutimaris TaxID=1538146 RepID=A0A395LH95_9SPHN|nr:N-acetyl-D-Glu racemase DgcA [Alteriqipengyuania lutimaris]MBB3035431.1 L-alanine-DL-glutamate epimerase-like enolase superfamily enzyme [Alteriqipengyuania lutimaris]RDS76005.1 dipeptide epimerase [Alteriqipengyuania lutimaris]